MTNISCVSHNVVREEYSNFRVFAFLFIISISIPGNLSVLFVIYRTITMRTVTNLLICNSTIADLLITLYPNLWEVIDSLKYKGRWPLGRFMCAFMHATVYVSVAATVLTLVVISVDRYCAVMLPYRKYLRKKHLRLVVPVIWVVAFSFASPTIFIQRVVYFKGYGYACVEDWKEPFNNTESPKHYTLVLFSLLYMTPLSLMSVLYAVMARKLMKQHLTIKRNHETLKNISSDEFSRQSRKNLVRHTNNQSFLRRKRVIKMLLSIVVVFALCWLPVYCLQFLAYFDSFYRQCPQSIPEWAYFIAFWVQYANSAINPILYFGFSKTYRKGFRTTFPFLFSKRKVNNEVNGVFTNFERIGETAQSVSMQSCFKHRLVDKMVVRRIETTSSIEHHHNR